MGKKAESFCMLHFRCVEFFFLLGYIQRKHALHKTINELRTMKKIAQNWSENMKPQTSTGKPMFIYLMIILILTNNDPFWGINLYCFISPCIDCTVVFERRTCIWHFSTTFIYSCCVPFLVILWTWFHFFCCCCWIVAFSGIHKKL